MKKSMRTVVAAVAFAAVAAQPIAAFATPPPVAAHPDYGYGVAWTVGFFLCDGMITGKQEKWANAHHTTVSAHDRIAGLVACIIPPIGLFVPGHH
jgi:hypothetical protein